MSSFGTYLSSALRSASRIVKRAFSSDRKKRSRDDTTNENNWSVEPVGNEIPTAPSRELPAPKRRATMQTFEANHVRRVSAVATTHHGIACRSCGTLSFAADTACAFCLQPFTCPTCREGCPGGHCRRCSVGSSRLLTDSRSSIGSLRLSMNPFDPGMLHVLAGLRSLVAVGVGPASVRATLRTESSRTTLSMARPSSVPRELPSFLPPAGARRPQFRHTGLRAHYSSRAVMVTAARATLGMSLQAGSTAARATLGMSLQAGSTAARATGSTALSVPLQDTTRSSLFGALPNPRTSAGLRQSGNFHGSLSAFEGGRPSRSPRGSFGAVYKGCSTLETSSIATWIRSAQTRRMTTRDLAPSTDADATSEMEKLPELAAGPRGGAVQGALPSTEIVDLSESASVTSEERISPSLMSQRVALSLLRSEALTARRPRLGHDALQRLSELQRTAAGVTVLKNSAFSPGLASVEARALEVLSDLRMRGKKFIKKFTVRGRKSFRDLYPFATLGEALAAIKLLPVTAPLSTSLFDSADEYFRFKDFELPFAEGDNAIIDAALARGSPDERMATINSVIVTREGMNTLNEREWLDDSIINGVLRMIVNRSLRSSPNDKPEHPVFAFNSFFFDTITQYETGYLYHIVKRWTKQVDVFSLAMVLVPINTTLGKRSMRQKGNHWTCAAVDFRRKRFIYLDSLGDKSSFKKAPLVLSALRRWVVDEHQDKKPSAGPFCLDGWTDHTPGTNVPQQVGGYDCGVFMLMFLRALSQDAPLNMSQEDVLYVRRRMVLELLAGVIV